MSQQGQQQCPFCQLLNTPDQTFDVHESEHFKAWLDINPRARGHTMIVPKDHQHSLDEMGDLVTELFEVIRIVAEKARNGLNADGVSVVINDGEAAGQKLDHFYAQVFPRYGDEENAGAPAGAVFQPMEGLDQNDLADISDAMMGADYASFSNTKTGPATNMIREKRDEPVDAEDDASGDAEEDADNDNPENEVPRGEWDGDSYHWKDRSAEFK